MENFEEPLPLMNNEDTPVSTEETVIYPPKFEKQEQTTNIWLKSFASLALYLILGFYIFNRQWKFLLIITIIVLFHELGHFFAMKFFRYKDLGIFFIPLLGAYVSGTKREVSQKESAIILLAGPLPGIILGIIMFLLYKSDPQLAIAGISFDRISLTLVLLNLINLFPVYPLDGGQLLNRVFLDEESWVSKGFVLLSVGLMGWFAWKMYSSSGQPFYFVFFLFPLTMLLRMFGDSRLRSIEKKIESEGIDMDKSYDQLPDRDYWSIRNVLITEHPDFKNIQPAPPYEYDAKEEKIMTTIEHMLHRHLIQDVSIIGKMFIIIIWAAAIASPWLLKMDMFFLRQFGL
jgi:Zn-dependent protease